jgi:hypothetical protein
MIMQSEKKYRGLSANFREITIAFTWAHSVTGGGQFPAETLLLARAQKRFNNLSMHDTLLPA